MANPVLANRGIHLEQILELADLTSLASDLDLTVVDHGDPSRVVTAILEALQPLYQERNDLSIADIANYATHFLRPW
jgi:hypothetical protein